MKKDYIKKMLNDKINDLTFTIKCSSENIEQSKQKLETNDEKHDLHKHYISCMLNNIIRCENELGLIFDILNDIESFDDKDFIKEMI